MNILYFSDIHLEIRESQTRVPWTDAYPLDLGPNLSRFRGRVDLVVLAGDIGPAYERRGLSAVLYARQVAEYLGCPVVLVPGNHCYYDTVFDDARDHLRAQSGDGVHVLDRDELVLEIGGRRLRILGATLWTDYAVAGDFREGMERAKGLISDHDRIMVCRGGMWQPADALEEHMKSRFWLEDRLAEPFDGPTLIVSHHVPHPAVRNATYGFDRHSAGFCSDLWELIKAAKAAGGAGWICGHNHWSMRTEIGGLPVVTAQWGYPHEKPVETAWVGPQVLEI